MQFTAIIIAALAGSSFGALHLRQANQTDVAVLPTGTGFPFICNAAAIARGACNGTAPNVPSVTTQVVTILTTYCPAATTFVVNSKTYTVTGETTLTITDCPCTIVGPITSTAPKAPSTTSAYVLCNAAAIARGACTATAATVPTTTASPAQFTGAADSVKPALALVVLGALALL